MRIYNITSVLRKHGELETFEQKDVVVLADNDDMNENIQMLYGCWYDVITYKEELANTIYISSNYIAQEAMKRIRFD